MRRSLSSLLHIGAPGRPASVRTCAIAPLVGGLLFASLSCTPVEGGTTEGLPVADDPIASYLDRAVPDSATVRAGLEAVEEAATLAGDERWDDAFATLQAALATLPALADWTPILLAEMRAAAGDTAGVRRQLASADRSTGLVERWGWLLTVEAYEKAEDFRAAGRLAELQARRSMPEAGSAQPNRAVAAHAWLRTGDLALADGDSARARAAFFRTLDVYPRSGHALRAARRLDGFADITPAETYRIGRVDHIHGDWSRAWTALGPRLKEPELSEEERHALRFDLGRALFHLSRYSEAEAHLLPLTPDSVPTDVAAEALFWTGRAQYRQGRRNEGRATLEQVAERYPEDRHAVQALFLLAELEESAGSASGARAFYERAFLTGQRSAEMDLAAVRIGSSAYLAGEYEFAAGSFDRYRTGSARTASRQQAAFWAALSHERLGNEAEAEERYREVYDLDPLTYYGAQAGNRLNLEILPRSLPIGPPATIPTSAPRHELRPELQNALLRLAVHQRVPLSGSFAFEFERQTAHFTRGEDRGYDYAEVLIANGFEIQGILLGRDFHREEGEWNVRLLRIVYPFPYRDAIIREATRRGLDPFFVAGLIRQESMFRPDIVSPAGAVGLMQIMPATGRQLASRAGVSSFSVAHLSDPEINIRMGTDFLSTMLDRFGGSVTDALSAYNAGPTRIRRWQNLDEYRDPNVFVEHIPFRETRNYVKVVQQNAHIYTALYGCEAFTSCRGMPYRSISSQSVEDDLTSQGLPDRLRNDR